MARPQGGLSLCSSTTCIGMSVRSILTKIQERHDPAKLFLPYGWMVRLADSHVLNGSERDPVFQLFIRVQIDSPEMFLFRTARQQSRVGIGMKFSAQSQNAFLHIDDGFHHHLKAFLSDSLQFNSGYFVCENVYGHAWDGEFVVGPV